MANLPRRSKVFVVNSGNHDYVGFGAAAFGDLVFLTEGRQNIFAVDNIRAEITAKLEEHDVQEQDYLLISGNILPNLLAYGILKSKFPAVKLLVWISNKQEYRLITV